MKYQHGGDIYTHSYRFDFSANINPFGMAEPVQKAAQEAVLDANAYPDVRCGRLRAAVAEKFHIRPETLTFGNGAAEVIFSLVLAEKPKKALILSPGFAEYEQALRTVGCEIEYFDRRRADGFRLRESFADHIKDETDIVFLCTPDNPTGGVIPEALLCRIAAVCKERNTRLVVDESFIEFVSDGKRCSMLEQIHFNPKLFVLRSFTKLYGMPGLRLGFGVCADGELLARMEEMRQPWSVSVPAQAAGVAACELRGWEEMVRTYVQAERVRMERELSQLGFEVFSSDANYILFYTEWELVKPLSERGILVRDCSNYRGLSKGFYRIAVKRREENECLIQALRELIQEG